jgi:hypothetical protein
VAKWVVYENRNKFLTLLYRNLTTGTTFVCGELRADTPTQLILRWVLEQAAAAPGDFIKFQDGSVLQLQDQGQA